MKNLIHKPFLFSAIVMLLGVKLANAQIGYLDTLFYKGVGVDFKCTSGFVLPDSSIIIAGKTRYVNERVISGVAKLKADGSNDYTFAADSGANDYVNIVVRQPDGKILAGGNFTRYSGTVAGRITRLNANGTIDTSFHTGIGFNQNIYMVRLQPDGKILVGGDFTKFNGQTVNRVARLNADGSIDNTFVIGTGANNTVYGIDVQTNGKVIIAGNFTMYHDTLRNRIIRANSDGSVDTSFHIGTGADNIITRTYLQPDGKIVAVGYFQNYNGNSNVRVIRLNTDGTQDVTYTTGTGFNNNVNDFVFQPDGKVIATGNFTSYNGTTRNRIARLNTDGTVDATFNAGGGPNLSCNTVFMNPDGKIYVGGTFTLVDSFARSRLARLNSNGIADNSFYQDSKLNNQIYAIAFQNGKAIIGGQFTRYNKVIANRIARLNDDGSVDTTFNTGIGANNIVRVIVVQPDGKIIIGGDFTNYRGFAVNRIVRLNADGTIDNNFTVGSGAGGSIYAMMLLPNGKILIAGAFTTYNGTTINRLARLNSDGTLDNSLSIGTGFNNTVFDIAVQIDGKILAAGSFTTYFNTSNTINRIVRIDSTGTQDANFVLGTGANNTINTVALQTDGKILIGGLFTQYNGATVSRISRLKTNGTLDSVYIATVNAGVNKILVLKQGGALVGGLFSTANGYNRIRLNYFDVNGNLDSTNFYIGAGVLSTALNTMAIDNSTQRRIYLGGDFEQINYHIATKFGRLKYSNLDFISSSNTFCPGATGKVVYAGNGIFNISNTFTVQISDSTGKFTTAVNIGSYTNFAAGVDSINITIPFNTPNGSHYRFRVISSSPTDTSNVSGEIIITAPPAPTISASGTTTFCQGGSVVLTASGVSGVYHWDTGDSTNSITVNSSGNYTAYVSNNGCIGLSQPKVVTVNPNPDSSITVLVVTICNGGTALLNAAPNLNYSWNTGEHSQSITITQSGYYSLNVSNSYGCTADSTLHFDFTSYFGAANTTTDPTIFCQGGNATLHSIPGYTYLWSNGATTQNITVTTSGDYRVIISDGTCFDTSSAIHIFVLALPTVSLTPSVTPGMGVLCSNLQPEFVLNTGTPVGGTYSGAFVSNDTLHAGLVGGGSTKVYYSYTDGNGCTANDSTTETIGICSGIAEAAESSISMYPNPAKDKLTIVSSDAIIRNLEVVDLLGNIVLRWNYTDARLRVILDLSTLPSGNYFLKAGEKKFRFVKTSE